MHRFLFICPRLYLILADTSCFFQPFIYEFCLSNTNPMTQSIIVQLVDSLGNCSFLYPRLHNEWFWPCLVFNIDLLALLFYAPKHIWLGPNFIRFNNLRHQAPSSKLSCCFGKAESEVGKKRCNWWHPANEDSQQAQEGDNRKKKPSWRRVRVSWRVCDVCVKHRKRWVSGSEEAGWPDSKN